MPGQPEAGSTSPQFALCRERAGPYQECTGQHDSTIKEINPDWYTPEIALEAGVERAAEVMGPVDLGRQQQAASEG